ncbi:MAG TPA: DMT family transporter [Methylophilaceae bacterium]|jgi:drug/metabolite transporter (DMT)-like permease
MLKNYMLAVLSAILWGANFNLSKPVTAELPPLEAACLRFLISAAVMLGIAWYMGLSIPKRHFKTYIKLSLMGAVGFNVFFFLGMQTTSAANGALIMALNPLLTSLIAYFVLKQAISKQQLWAFPIGVLGVGIVVLGGGAQLHIARGDLLILAASVCWAFYNVYTKKIMPQDVSGIANTAAIMTVGAIVLSCLTMLSGKEFIMPSAHASGALLMMSLGGGVLAYLFWNASIVNIGASQAAIFMNLIPVASMGINATQGIAPTMHQILGGLLVIGAVTFASIPMKRFSLKTAEQN